VSRYELWKFLHIMTSMVWVGGAGLFQILTLKAAASGDPAESGRIGQTALWTGTRVFMPASIAVLVLGVVMVLDSPLGFDELWIGLGLIGLIVTVVIGAGFITPTGRRIGQSMAERGPQDPVTQQLVRRQMFLTRLNLLLLVAVVFDMVVKPGS
jgi:uncharacterized membrane protein